MLPIEIAIGEPVIYAPLSAFGWFNATICAKHNDGTVDVEVALSARRKIPVTRIAVVPGFSLVPGTCALRDDALIHLNINHEALP